ncbi:MAG: YciI family protein [Proteobacteria bacterium]|nr:YciI family protein [Pseudomonadota bacterium]
MKYMCLIYGAEAKHPQAGTPEMGQLMENYMAFTGEARENNVMVAGDPLEPVATATTVRLRGGKVEITDGPFAETKEQLGGYYILDCKDLDEAIAYAARIPTAAFGSIEVRPIMVFD